MEENHNYIALNFSPLKNQHFSFIVYRKKKEPGSRKENFDNSVSERSLKFSNNVYSKYWVSYDSIEGFLEYQVTIDENRYLTHDYIYNQLLASCKSKLNSGDFFEYGKGKYRRIAFVNDQYREGKQIVWVEPYFLDVSQEFGFLIDFGFLGADHQPSNRVVQKLSLSLNEKGRANTNFYADRYAQIRKFAKKYYERVFLETDLDFESNKLLPVDYLEKKTYIVGDDTETTSQYSIKTYGPYESFSEHAYIYFLYRKEEVNLIKDFYPRLEEKLNEDYKFDFQFKSYRADTIDDGTISSITEELNQLPLNSRKIVIFLLRKKGDNDDLYYKIKHKFTSNQIATQFLSYEILRNKYSMGNTALQIFAKLGGKPWKVKPRNEKCLIIGLSQSMSQDERYFAYSILIDSSGLYKALKVISEDSEQETYLTKLGDTLKNIISEYSSEYDKIAIHTPFKVKREELEKIKSILEEYSSGKLEFLVLRINTDNKFFGYQKAMNSLTPYESSCVKISNTEFLVWFEGLQYHDTKPQKRYSGPTYIKLHYSNNQLDETILKNYIQDIINLSGANWRGFNARSLPVSIYYCRLVSVFIREFKNRDMKDIEIENSEPWFL
ncbi:MAG: Piwi domain-containing protein [Cyclobacteriaceae bacterium]